MRPPRAPGRPRAAGSRPGLRGGRSLTPRLALLPAVLPAFIFAAVLTSLSAPARAQTPAASPSGIYTCTDAAGRRLTSDRPIPDCVAREQRVLNADGSVRRVVPPSLTADERAAREAQERQQAQTAAQQRDAARRDRNLLMRYPNEAAHQSGREQALQQTRRAIEASEARLAALAAERKPLLDESEFYVGRSLPLQLKQQLDANDAATRAQRDAVQTQQAELRRVNDVFDLELERLKRLWAGAAPGSMGPMGATASNGSGTAAARPGGGASPGGPASAPVPAPAR